MLKFSQFQIQLVNGVRTRDRAGVLRAPYVATVVLKFLFNCDFIATEENDLARKLTTVYLQLLLQ